MQLLSKYRLTSLIGLLKTVIKGRIFCAVVFYEEIIALFELKNLKLKPKMTKNPKLSNFQSFYAVFVEFMTDFFEWNVKKGQQGKKLLSSSLL